ncbi:substrate-binding domain-containing protein [Streptomyces sp. NA04227]|uniref:PstS family phosphate ABC transporter substrate-binding protein n=1 Tax=Streptomyces sp. NA04227 TaxID=2742136 RepID=UPI00159221AE|nr:substrate-binding domain-containing protein [Streptomyces sp. NA04227]QKW08389.1 substrate-binding domain-containing protein [Streptomyces sp. NA04227]
MDFSWQSVIAVLGLVVPLGAAVWEFVLVGRKRLGYRVQMDTAVRDQDTVNLPHTAVLRRMQQNGRALKDPSFVLLRIENSGWTDIEPSHYATSDIDTIGIRVLFPGRRVIAMAVTEPSHAFLLNSFESRESFSITPAEDRSGEQPGDGSGELCVINLPRVPLNRRTHYKVLALLERDDTSTPSDFRPSQERLFPEPEVRAGVRGGIRGGAIRETKSHTLASKPVMALLLVLVMLVGVQSFDTIFREEDHAAPLDCASGTLHLSGSTAFEPVVREAAKQYVRTCTDAEIPLTENTFKGSVEGINTLTDAGKADKGPGVRGLSDHLTFTDGPRSKGHPRLLPRPVSLSLFTLVVREDVEVENLSLAEIRDIYAGRITNWRQVGAEQNLPIQLIGRYPGSGSRTTLIDQVLRGKKPLAPTEDDCKAMDLSVPGRCEVGKTSTLLDTVSGTPGALGYSEVGATGANKGLTLIRIDGAESTLQGAEQGAYPFWQTEVAYTYGEPPAGSIAAGFLRYLANEVGKDIVRSHGHRPCAELENPLLCRPS